MKQRKPIRKVSVKRAKANALYSKLRKQFLEEHPYCQWWLSWHGFTQDDVDDLGYIETNLGFNMQKIPVPKATEIHHMKKPKQTYLNDTSTWMAVSRQGHEWIENNKAEAREKGFLFNI